MTVKTTSLGVIVFGCPVEIREVRGFPFGRIRLKFRQDDFGIAFVYCSAGIRKFFMKESPCGRFWEPAFEAQRNFRVRAIEMERWLTDTTDSYSI